MEATDRVAALNVELIWSRIVPGASEPHCWPRLAGLCNMGPAMAMKSHTQRSLLLAFIISIGCCGAIGIYCLLVGQMGPLEARILGSTSAVGAASILGLVSAIPWERRRWHPIGPAGMAFVVVALALVLVTIWIDRPWRYEPLWKSMGIACVGAVAFPHIGLLSLARLRRQYGWVRWATVIVIVALAAHVSVIILAEADDDLWFRLMGVLAIGDVCGTITIPILHRVSAIRLREAIQTVELSLSLTCPRCNKTQQLPVGRCKCAGCGLKFKIEIEEEHCTVCGYPLYRLESSVCPECGTPIARNILTAGAGIPTEPPTA